MPTTRAIACRGLVLTTAVSLIGFCTAVPASAHYVQPPGDQEAAPAIVQIRTSLTFDVTLHDMHQAELGSRRIVVPGPSGTGAVFDPSGAVVTSTQTAFPAEGAAHIVAANTAFNDHHHLGWTAAQLKKKQTVSDPEMKEMLQECYGTGGGHCVVKLVGRPRQVAFNTTTPTMLDVGGRDDAGSGLYVLHTRAERDRTPTVGIDTDVAPDADYVAMGYTSADQLARVPGKLEQGQLTEDQVATLSKTFPNGGDGVVLVNPTTKGTILGVLSRTGGSGLRLVPSNNPLTSSGYVVERGVFDSQIDEALGYFTGKHYTHAIPLLKTVTKTLPDRELLADLATADKLKGGPQDKSESMSHSDAAASSAGRGISWGLVIPLVLAGIALVAGVWFLVRRRRRAAAEESMDEDDYDSFPLADDEDARETDVLDRETHAGDAGAVSADTSGRSGDFDHRGSVGRPLDGIGSRTPPGGTTMIQATDLPSDAAHYCPSCGVGLVAGDRFCYHCGTPAR